MWRAHLGDLKIIMDMYALILSFLGFIELIVIDIATTCPEVIKIDGNTTAEHTTGVL